MCVVLARRLRDVEGVRDDVGSVLSSVSISSEDVVCLTDVEVGDFVCWLVFLVLMREVTFFSGAKVTARPAPVAATSDDAVCCTDVEAGDLVSGLVFLALMRGVDLFLEPKVIARPAAAFFAVGNV